MEMIYRESREPRESVAEVMPGEPGKVHRENR